MKTKKILLFVGILAVLCVCVIGGLELSPLPPPGHTDSKLIWYKGNNRHNIKYWTDEIDKFLAEYKQTDSSSKENAVLCTYEDLHAPAGRYCDVDVTRWAPCVSENNYNYHNYAPCVFLKLKMTSAWQPDVYNDTEKLPDKMPLNLQDHIKSIATYNKHALNTVWLDCEGENPGDVENIGPITYYPRRDFPGYYFPSQNVKGYLSPLVAVQFNNPKRGIVINIVCKAWARNLSHDPVDQLHFNLMID